MSERVLTREILQEYLSGYSRYQQEINEHQQQVAKQLPVASIAQYGIQAAMPKAQGNKSDPTFNQATSSGIDDYIARRIAVVRAVDGFKKHIKGIREADVLDLWLCGLSAKEIADKLKVSKATVSRCRDEILNKILEGEKLNG